MNDLQRKLEKLWISSIFVPCGYKNVYYKDAIERKEEMANKNN
jgi:hypothetical protein